MTNDPTGRGRLALVGALILSVAMVATGGMQAVSLLLVAEGLIAFGLAWSLPVIR